MATCLDATPENNPECYSNITWAMETGITTNPVWYADYPILSEYRTRAAFQYVLHEKRGPGEYDGTGKPDGPGYNCTMPCNIGPKPCFDVTETSPGICYANVIWAMETGITDYPQYYTDFPQLTKNSSFNDFQYVLNVKVNDNRTGELPNGPGWQCPKPCTSALFIPTTTSTIPVTSTANMTRDIEPTNTTLTSTTTSTTSTTTTEASSSFPWWAWLLLVLGLVLCLGAIAAFFFFKKGGAAKKAKRSVTPKKGGAVPAPAAPATYSPAPVATAPPVYTQVQPVQTVTAPPVYTQVMPVQTAAVPMAAPVQAMAVPAYQYAAAPQMQQASSLFDQMDVNHDGVITRAEFARMMGR